jgi:MFS family permease
MTTTASVAADVPAQRGAAATAGTADIADTVTLDAPATKAAGYREVFAIREFRALWLARTLSLLGDQLARVALTILVFRQTGSAFVTGLVYGLTYLPYLIGLLLAGLADRQPRRSVMLVGDLICALGVVAMAVPGQPLTVVGALLVAVTIVSPVYDAARAALIPDVLPGDLYVVGSGVTTMTFGTVQVLGFGVGGALVAIIGPRPALALDALTFLVSAAVIWTRVSRRPAAHTEAERPLTQVVVGARLVFGTPQLRRLVWLAWLWALWIVPEGLAAPYAAELHGGAVTTGLLLAAAPVGAVLGGAVLTRFVGPERRMRLLTPFALLAAAPLVVMAAHPNLGVSLALWVLAGVGTAYNLPANAAFVRALPDERRGQGFALAQTGIMTGQGAAVMVAGALAGLAGPAPVIAIAGVLGLVAVMALGLSTDPNGS